MTKEQGEAIVAALQAGCEYLSSVQYKLGPGKLITETPGGNLLSLTDTFETIIADIMENFPDDSGGGGGGGGVSGKMPVGQIVGLVELQAPETGTVTPDASEQE